MMAFFSSPGQTFFISLFSGQIRADLMLSHGQFGGIYSFATLLSAIVMIWSGVWVDRMDLRKFAILSVTGLMIGCLFMSFSVGLVSLLVGIFILRHMGQGLMFLASSTAMVRYLEENKGKASALGGMGYSVSEIVMPSLVIAMMVWFEWRTSWLIFGVAVAVLMIPLIRWLLENHDQRHSAYLKTLQSKQLSGEKRAHLGQWTRREVIRDKLFYLFMPGLMSQPLLFTGFIFHQVHLVEAKNWTLSMWGTLFALYAIVSVLTKFFIGFWVDRYGAVRMVPLLALPMALGFVMLAFSSHPVAAFGFLVFTGITVGFQNTVSAPFWAELYGVRHLGSIKSLATSTMVFSSALSPIVLGWMIDQEVSIEALSLAAAVYIVVTSSLALYAYRLSVNRTKRQ